MASINKILGPDYYIDRKARGKRAGNTLSHKAQPYSPNLFIKRSRDNTVIARITQVSDESYHAEYMVCVIDYDGHTIKHIQRCVEFEEAVACAVNNVDSEYDPDGVALDFQDAEED